MSYSKNAQKKYMEKCKTYAVKYTPVDMSINNVLEKHLSDNNISFNSYAKNLIRNDLISKGLIKESE